MDIRNNLGKKDRQEIIGLLAQVSRVIENIFINGSRVGELLNWIDQRRKLPLLVGMLQKTEG